MVRRLNALGFAIAFLTVAACSDDSTSSSTQSVCESLPQSPQILPNAQAGVVPFDLLAAGEMQTLDIVFVNGGQDELAVSDIRVEGDAFRLGTVTPDTKTVACGKALAAQVRFTSPGRGVHLGRLVVESNAGNFSSLELELVGPSAGDVIPDAADIAVVESSVEVQEISGLTIPAALIRYYNLGGKTLLVDRYTIADSSSFRFLTGTEVPGSSCVVGAACEPETGAAQGCCGTAVCSGTCNGGAQDGLPCTDTCDGGTCEQLECGAVRVVSGDFVLFGVRFADSAPSGNPMDTTVTLHTENTDPQEVTVTVTGTP